MKAWAARLAFVDVKEEARRFPKLLHRTGLQFMREIERLGLGPIVATTAPGNPRHDEWLLRLGLPFEF